MSMILHGKQLLAACLAVGLSAGMSSAQDIPPGCYERIYSDAHLAKHPEQVVHMIRFRVGNWITEVAREGWLSVVPVGQGHAPGGDPWANALGAMLFCGSETSDPRQCFAECDAGALEVSKWDASGLTFRTRYLMVGAGQMECGGALDLAERPGTLVSYRLNAVPDANCDGM